MKFLKIGLGVVASILTALIIAVVAFAWLFDPNSYKNYITGFVEQRTGRTLEIEDDLELTYFPWLAVETGGITLSNAEGFDDRPFATVDRASARVKLIPLFRREFEVGTIRLDGLELNLGRDAAGRTNWQDLLARGSDTADSDSRGASNNDSGAAYRALDIEGLVVRGSRVVWLDENQDPALLISNLNLQTSAIGSARPTDIVLSFDALDVATQYSGHVETTTRVAIDERGTIDAGDVQLEFSFADANRRQRMAGQLDLARVSMMSDGALSVGTGKLDTTLSEPPVGPASLPVQVRWREASVAPQWQRLQVEGLETELAGSTVSWQLELDSPLSAAQLGGNLAVSSGSVAGLFQLFGIEPPEGLRAGELGDYDASTTFQVLADTRSLRLTDARAHVFGTTIRAKDFSADTNRVLATVEVEPFSPDNNVASLLRQFLPEDIDTEAFDELALSGRIDARLDTGALAVSDLHLQLLGGSIDGNVSMQTVGDGRVLSGTLDSSRFNAGDLQAFGALMSETLDAADLGMLSIGGTFSYDTSAQKLIVSPARLEVMGVQMRGELTASDLAASPNFTGRARTSEFDPRQILRRFGHEPPITADPSVLRRASIDSRFTITSSAARFEDLQFLLDDSRATGRLEIIDFSEPTYRFDIAIDGFNAEQYMQPQAARADAEPRRLGDLSIEGDTLSGLTLDGNLSVGNLRIAGMSFQNIRTSIGIGNGRLQLDSTRASLYGGQFEGRFGISTTGAAPAMSLSGRATALELEPLIVSLYGNAILSGNADFEIDLSGSGSTVTDNLRSSNGRLGFTMRNGAIDGLNVTHEACATFNARLGRAAPQAPPANLTRYEVISGTATVTAGTALSRDIVVRNADLQVAGSGELDLAERIASYEFDARLLRSIALRGCETLDQIIGRTVPLKVYGEVPELVAEFDFREFVRNVVQDEIRDRARDRILDRLRN